MKKFLTLIIFFIFISGCKTGIPKEIIQPDKMDKVLFDIHVVDGYLGTITNVDTAKIIASSYYKGIYKKFGIDSALYNKSMDYYYAHPTLLNEIYTKVEKSFALENSKLEKSIVIDENIIYGTNSSLVILINLPVATKGPMIAANPFDITLSLSRL